MLPEAATIEHSDSGAIKNVFYIGINTNVHEEDVAEGRILIERVCAPTPSAHVLECRWGCWRGGERGSLH
jgi:hypothetical protein